MVWDFAEANPFANAGGSFAAAIDKGVMAIRDLPKTGSGFVYQQDAQTQEISQQKLISTDPPYYDNIPYADLSDFFYVWLRRSLRTIFLDYLPLWQFLRQRSLLLHLTVKVGEIWQKNSFSTA